MKPLANEKKAKLKKKFKYSCYNSNKTEIKSIKELGNYVIAYTETIMLDANFIITTYLLPTIFLLLYVVAVLYEMCIRDRP